ncbi:RICIN domain-containing protein [Microbacter margulisiae]|uniref:Ricin B lectin domain-containing protein n=1 Tax=Microbacter margulisiae TaxID=1350067 RepID=A0A7W5DRF2_9PORP|nr:RICIN domain-containing protein [Microbacter margulisiae]MBB3187365.1 hypothetical protein [Microbacter margulisiae]
MNKHILQLILLCLAIFLTSCQQNAIEELDTISNHQTHTSQLTSSNTNTIGIRGINWADPNGNAPTSSVVLPSGLTASSTVAQAATVAGNIADAVLASGGTTVRMPITYTTTSNSSYWPVYQSAINAIVSKGCHVILCYWSPTGGVVTDSTEWHAMWTSVDNVYKNNSMVLYEPINEPYSYSTSNLLTLYSNFMAIYSPSSYKCIFDGTGYAADVTTIGGSSAISNQYLGLHCYWWFWGAYNVWSDYYNIMSSRVGSYASRTIVTELGVETFRTFDFWWQWQTGAENDVAFLTGSLAYAKDNSIGTIAWSGVNDIDTYRWFNKNDTLVEINPGCANMYRWSWGLSPIWLGAKANGTYKLQNRATGLYLDSYGLTTSPSNVYQYTSSSSLNQNWEITYVDGYYTIYSISGGLCLDAGNNTTDGSAILQMTRGTPGSQSYTQQWTIALASSGYYKLINRATGKCLDTGGLTASGSALQQWYSNSSYNQQWQFVQQ